MDATQALLEMIQGIGIPLIMLVSGWRLKAIAESRIEGIRAEFGITDRASAWEDPPPTVEESIGKTASRRRAEELISIAESEPGRDYYPDDLGCLMVGCRRFGPFRYYVVYGVILGEWLEGFDAWRRERAIAYVHSLILKYEGYRLSQDMEEAKRASAGP